MGNNGFLPDTNSYGENPVIFLHVVLYAHSALGKFVSPVPSMAGYNLSENSFYNLISSLQLTIFLRMVYSDTNIFVVNQYILYIYLYVFE